jgi:hypothetical protein
VSVPALEQLSAFLIPARRLEAKRGHLPTPWPALNEMLGGGWPRGALSEVSGPRSSGRTSVLYASLGAALQRGAAAALVDAESALDARRAQQAGIPLRQLLWVCAGQSQILLKSTELLVSAGGFELVALDLGDSVPHLPTTAWIRLRQVAQRQGTVVLLAAGFPLAGSCSATSVHLQQKNVDFGRQACARFRPRFGVDDHASARVVAHPPLVTALASSVSLERGRRTAEQAAHCSLVFQARERAGASGQKSGHVLGDEAPGRQGATREHSRPYVTEEQRSRTGWIGSQNMPEILTGGTRAEGT